MRSNVSVFSVFFLVLFFSNTQLYSQTDHGLFTQKEVSFYNGDIRLSGTLLLPIGKGPFPGVVFVHGSGPETRDNSMFSAVWFTSIGYAALIYDKRGAGKSGGDKNEIKNFSFENLAGDVLAAINLLKDHKAINKLKIGLHVSSQGGWVAPLAASKTDLISFMIMRAVSVVSVEDDRVFERSERLKNEGFSDIEIEESQQMQMLEGFKTDDPDSKKFDILFEENKEKKWFKSVYGDTELSELANHRNWYSNISKFDPIPIFEQTHLPIIWFFGDASLDKLGPIDLSIKNLKRLQKDGKNFQIHSYEDEGHNINEAKYEKDLFEWLNVINPNKRYVFKTHLDRYKKYYYSIHPEEKNNER